MVWAQEDWFKALISFFKEILMGIGMWVLIGAAIISIGKWSDRRRGR